MLHALDILKRSILAHFKHSAYHVQQAIHEFPFARLERRAEAISGEFNSQNVAYTTQWAFATMGRKLGKHVKGQLERRAEAISGEFQPQEVTSMMWALVFVTMGDNGNKAGGAFDGAAGAADGGDIREFTSQAVANTL